MESGPDSFCGDPVHEPDPGFLNPDSDHIHTAAALSLSRPRDGSADLGKGLCCPSTDILKFVTVIKVAVASCFHRNASALLLSLQLKLEHTSNICNTDLATSYNERVTRTTLLSSYSSMNC